MTSQARAALKVIRQAIEDERYIVTAHFNQRMDERGLMWPDVISVIEAPTEVRDDGMDRIGRPKWVVAGPTSDDLPIEVVCVLDEDEAGNTVVLVTLYWK